MWLLNSAKYINWEEFDSTTFSGASVTLGATAATLSDGSLAFLRTDADGYRAVSFYDFSEGEMTNYRVSAGTVAATSYFVFNAATDVLYKPTSLTIGSGDKLYVLYGADAYASAAGNKYFAALDDANRPGTVGAIRQGQVEIYIVAPDDVSYSTAWRLTGCTMTADLTRTPLTELGHLGPYDRPLTLPIPINVTIDTTAGDLANWARFAKRYTEYEANTLNNLALVDLTKADDLKLVVKIFAQTDEEAGGTGSNRKVGTGSDIVGAKYFNDGVLNNGGGVYVAGDREYALKTIVVEHLKITDEAYNIDMGANGTQNFTFRSTNDLYMVKGDVSISHITGDFKIRRNG
jgi:hypothetical protein